jgi:hypothetical protein
MFTETLESIFPHGSMSELITGALVINMSDYLFCFRLEDIPSRIRNISNNIRNLQPLLEINELPHAFIAR